MHFYWAVSSNDFVLHTLLIYYNTSALGKYHVHVLSSNKFLEYYDKELIILTNEYFGGRKKENRLKYYYESFFPLNVSDY